MLKKLLKDKDKSNNVFPITSSAIKQESRSDEHTTSPENGVVAILNERDLSELIIRLVSHDGFISQLEQKVTPKLLEILQHKYEFAPTKAYREDALQKKQYIEQLDEYLKERKEIHQTVENDLQGFLQETATNLSKTLESFTQNIYTQIKEAENRHGIDAIKSTLLNNNTEEQPC